MIPRLAGYAGGLSEATTYSINAMAWGTVELEPEVRDWLEQLPTDQFARAAFYVDLWLTKDFAERALYAPAGP